MFSLEKLNARKLSFTSKMGISEDEELFLLGFIFLNDKRKKKKAKKRRFWVYEIFRQRERQGMFSNLLVSFNLLIENIILKKYLFNNIFTSVFDKIFKIIRFFDIYIQYTMKV